MTGSFKETLDGVNQRFADFQSFVGGKLRNFGSLSLGEQISYPAVGLGVLLILVGIVLLIL